MTTQIEGNGSYVLGPVEVELELSDQDVRWRIGASSAVPLEKVSLDWNLPAGDRVRIFSNGYQSWSRAGMQVLGEDRDPSLHRNSIELVRAFH
ncbi:MAG: hypothetical protein ACRD1T_19910, partial [Acidimicrobiia bacterium]